MFVVALVGREDGDDEILGRAGHRPVVISSRVSSRGVATNEILDANGWNVLGGEGPDPPVASRPTLAPR